jgi:Ca2+-binding EF-hand superfamily protein
MLLEPESLHRIKTQLCLELDQIYQIYSYFNRLDKSSKGYLELDDLIDEFSKYD